MVPSFREHQIVQIAKHHKPHRFDVVVFQPDKKNEPMYLKRVIGLSGEEITYREGILYVNQQAIYDPFAEETEDFEWEAIQRGKIPEGYYFVLGDNRTVSKDSRSMGLIAEKQIKGIVKERITDYANNSGKN